MSTAASIVVVNWNSGDDLLRALASALAQSWRPRAVVVVDNASKDGSAERARARFPEVRFLELGTNRGFAGGANAGLEAAGPGPALLLNPDAWLDERYLERALPHLERPGIGFVAGKVLRADGKTIDTAGQTLSPVLRRVRERGYGQADRGQFEDAGPVPSVCGAVALYGERLRDALTRDGEFFDEDYFAFWEDADLGARARRAGFGGWYEPRALAYHKRGGTRPRERRLLGRVVQLLGRDDEVRYHILKNRYLFLARNEPWAGLVVRAPAFLAADGAVLVATALLAPSLFRRLLGAWPLVRRAWRKRGLP